MMHHTNHLRSIRFYTTCAVVLMFSFSTASTAAGVGSFFDIEEGINIMGLGIGQLPDHQGSDDYEVGVAPFGRYYFSGERYINLLGPQLSLNILDDEVWQFGPILLRRFGRGKDVEDSTVSMMRGIDNTVEAGAFVAASFELNPNDKRERIILSADILADTGDAHEGWIGTVGMKYWAPVSRMIVMHVGGGFSYASDDYVNTYYGVNDSDIALFPSLSGSAYVAEGGINDVRATIGAIVHLSPNWHLGLGARYQRLLDDAEDSPVVNERGDSNQWIYGLGLGYAWQ